MNFAGESFGVGLVLVETRQLREHGADELVAIVRQGVDQMGLMLRAVIRVRPNVDLIAEQVALMADQQHLDCVVTVGGAGIDPDDVAPDAMVQIIHRPTPGIPELLRAKVGQINPEFALTRGAAGTRGRTLIINLPGAVGDLQYCLDVLYDVLPAALRRLVVQGERPARQIRLL